MSERPRFRRLRRIAAAVLVVLVVLILGVAWLVATPSGARFAVARAQGLAPGTLSVGQVDGTLLGTLDISGVEYALDDTRVAIGRLSLQVAPGVVFNFRRLTIRALRVDGVTVRYPPGAPEPEPEPAPGPPEIPPIALPPLPVAITVEELEATDIALGPADGELRRIDRVALVGRLSGQRLDLSALEVLVPEGRFGLSGRADLSAPLAVDVRARWSLTGPSGASGILTVAGTRSGYDVRHELLAPAAVNSTGTMRLPVAAEPEARLRHVAESAELELGGRSLRIGELDIETTGRYTAWRVEGRAHVAEAALGRATVEVSVAGNGGAIAAEAVDITPDMGGALSLTGDIDGWPEARWNARLEATAAPLALVAADVDGTLDAAVNATGRLGGEPFVEATIEALSGRWREVELAADGALAWRSDTATFDGVRLAVGTNRAVLDGRVGTDAAALADLTFEVDAPDLGAIAPELGGRLRASGRLAGPLRTPEADARFELAGLRAPGIAVASASGRVVLGAAGERVDLDTRASGVSAGGLDLDDVEATVNGTPASHRLSVTARGEQLPSVSLSAAGGLADDAWRGRVLELDAVMPDAYGGDAFALEAPFDVALTPDGFSVGRACLAAAPAPRVCAAAALDGDIADLRASLTGLPLDAWGGRTPLGLKWTGTADASVELRGPRDRLSGSARIGVAELAARREADDTTIAFDDARVDATLDAGVLDATARFDVVGGAVAEAAFAFGDVYGSDGALEGRVGLTIPDVTAVNALVDAVQFSEGAFRAEASFGGTRDAPVITSRIDASEVRARLLPLGIEIADVRIDADNEDSEVLRFSGSGRSGEGRFELRGETALAEGAALATRASVRAEQFTFLDLPDRSAVASLDLVLDADRKRQSLTGNLTVDRADIRVQSLPDSAVPVSSDVVRVGEDVDAATSAPAARVERTMDVTVRLSDAVRLDAFGLRGRLEGAMDLRKRPAAALQGFGTVDVRDGVYKAYGQTLDVVRGRLVFNGPLDAPVLDVRAEREVADKRVGIEIAGTPDALESSLYSQPPLPEAEAFSLLITGRSLASAGESGDTPLGDIALALGLREAFAVGSAVRDAVGLDTLTLEGGGRDGRVLAGKQISPDLYLQYAYGVFDQLSSVLLRLQINDRLSLESTSGQAQSVDIVYSVGAR